MIGKLNNTYYYRASYIDSLTGKRIRKCESGFKTKKEATLKEQTFLKDIFLNIYSRIIFSRHRLRLFKPYIQIKSYEGNKRIYEKYILPHFKKKN